MPATGPSFRDATRVAGANPPLWTGIYAANAAALAARARRRDRRAAGASATTCAPAPTSPPGSSRRASDRAALLSALAAGPVRELRALVPNRPGVVAEIALALGRAGINISDMALSPSPDGERGEIALSVPEARAEEAAALVIELGFGVDL